MDAISFMDFSFRTGCKLCENENMEPLSALCFSRSIILGKRQHADAPHRSPRESVQSLSPPMIHAYMGESELGRQPSLPAFFLIMRLCGNVHADYGTMHRTPASCLRA